MIPSLLINFFPKAYAQIHNPVFGEYIEDNPTPNQAIRIGITALLIGGVLAAFAYLVLGAIKWITSGGDKNQLAAAKEQIIQAIIGLFILLSVFVIMNLIGYFFNINLLELQLYDPTTIEPGVPAPFPTP